MRALLFAGAALIASPSAAQDHSAHGGHDAQEEPEDQDDTGHGMPEEDAPSEAQANPLGQIRLGPTARPAPATQPQHDHAGMEIPTGPPPPRAFEGPAHAADAIWGEENMVAARGYNRATHGDQTFFFPLIERLEARLGGDEDEYLWDAQAWYGTAVNRVVFKTEGEGEFGGDLEGAEVQLLYSRAIGPFFDLQGGIRLDVEPGTTAYAAIGVQGLAPYMIHLDATAFLSDDGNLLARVEAEHDMRLTQKLVLQPRIEFELSAQDIPERGLGAGLPKIETGLRLRYEFVPEFAPYVGVEYEAATGRTADIIRAAGDDPDGIVFLLGLRAWF
ncbi:copper resistance protein B [Aurantiacibacter aquimixticola]|uniref:Copper resistance protein B n=1 Tax=Aurantiacibacter aquimixticola TaxID=1958945 RepID=A0A419RVE2_9SPHN|nr:copper resistance protein B [Aurantiacibacter aquimixticola]RJY09751.1 copper resistance protein B [Aurantiacibacter aquimixticola]